MQLQLLPWLPELPDMELLRSESLLLKVAQMLPELLRPPELLILLRVGLCAAAVPVPPQWVRNQARAVRRLCGLEMLPRRARDSEMQLPEMQLPEMLLREGALEMQLALLGLVVSRLPTGEPRQCALP